MVRHIYFFRLKDPAAWKSVAAKLLTLKDHIPEILSMEVGRDFRGAENSYDLCQMITFRSMEDFLTFSRNEYHAGIRQEMAQLQRESAKIDYEIPDGANP